MQLEKTKEDVTRTKEQLEFAEKAYEKALQVKKAFMREKDNKIREAREALRASERAQWQAKIADTLEQFEVGGVDQTHDEMVNRLNEETAKNEARMEIALDSIDTQAMQIEVDADKLRASEMVKQFKLEMGVDGGDKAEKAEKPKVDVDLEQKEESASTKTVGKQKTK
jgi:phage shock protein A